jgi:hypothetical protein
MYGFVTERMLAKKPLLVVVNIENALVSDRFASTSVKFT